MDKNADIHTCGHCGEVHPIGECKVKDIPTKTMTANECGNQHGYLCPKCKKGDCLTISAVRAIEARLYPDGTDDDGGDTEWNDDSIASCGGCNWTGVVEDLEEVEIVEDDEEEETTIGEILDEGPTVCEEHIDVVNPACPTCRKEWKEQTGEDLIK